MTTTTSADEIAEQFDVAVIGQGAIDRPVSYNVAPTQQIIVVADHKNGRRLETMRWGLVPFFVKDRKSAALMINARAEAVPDKPAYRRAFEKRRCIVPADGFYEWQKLDAKKKQPWYFHSRDGSMLGFAGLWEVWHDPSLPDDADPLFSVAIITVDANDDMIEIHDRMPLVLDPSDYETWLDVDNHDMNSLKKLLVPPADGRLEKYPISNDVNSVTNDRPELLLPSA